MSNNSYRSDRKHTRLSFTPLNVSCSLVCVTPQSPCTQASNSLIGEYEPNREGSAGTPCVIWPETRVRDKDGVFQDGYVNGRFDLSSIVWLVNGKIISMLSDWKDKYEIITNGNENRGSIKIKRNVAPSEEFVLSFEAKFEDWRTGTIMDVRSDDIVLNTTDKGDNKTSCSVDTPNINYDPLDDRLLKYEYMVANGLISLGNRASYIDGKAYERTVNIVFLVGDVKQNTLPSGIAMQLLYKGGTSALTANSEASPEVLSIAYPSIKLDLRLIDVKEYEVRFLKNGKIINRDYISVVRKMRPVLEAFPNRGADIVIGQQMYFNDGTVLLNDKAVDYPELYYFIQWYTQAREYNASNGTYIWREPVKRQIGINMQCEVNSLGIGKTKNDSYFGVFFDVIEDEACQLLADESGTNLCDESGVLLID